MFSAVAGKLLFLGGGNLGVQNLRGPGGNLQEIFEIFIPEIIANASNFNYIWRTHLLILSSLHNYWRRGWGWGVGEPPSHPLAMALLLLVSFRSAVNPHYASHEEGAHYFLCFKRKLHVL